MTPGLEWVPYPPAARSGQPGFEQPSGDALIDAES